jgi:hypothetical protein
MPVVPSRAETAAAPVSSVVLSPWAIGLAYLVLTLAATWPLAAQLTGATFRHGADTDLVVWILGWDAHAFLHQPLSIFDANIYYPERHTLAFAENLIGSALVAAPVIWLTHNIVLALNVVIILSCALCGLGGYLLGRRLGMSGAAAFIGGAVFAFAPPRFGRLSQPHLNAVQWLPLMLAFLHGYLDTGRRRDLWLAVGFLSLQVLSSGHGAVYAVICAAALLAYRVALGEPVDPLRRLRDFGVAGCLAVLPTILVMLPYRSVQREAGLERGLTADWFPPAVNFISSNTHFHQFLISLVPSLQINERATGVLFVGFLPLVLAVAALWPQWRRMGKALPRGEGATDGLPAGAGERAPLPWRGVALVLDLLALAALCILVYRTVHGPFKARWDRQVVFSAGAAWRSWLVAAALVGLRVSVWRQIAFDPLRWVRPAARVGSGVARFAWRSALRAPVAIPEWRAAHRQSAALFYALLAIGSLLLTAPPPFGIWPLVYWLPGFNMIRVAARFTIITVLAVATLAGFGFDRLSAGFGPRARRVLAVAVMLMLAVEFTAVPMGARPYIVDTPAIDRWLDTLPKPFVVAEFPVPVRRGTSTFESYQGRFMLHATAHWQRTIHGFSGHRTALHEDLFDLLATFPDQASVQRLKELKVTYAVVHTDYYPPGGWERVEPQYAALGDRLRLIHVEGAGRVYAID